MEIIIERRSDGVWMARVYDQGRLLAQAIGGTVLEALDVLYEELNWSPEVWRSAKLPPKRRRRRKRQR